MSKKIILFSDVHFGIDVKDKNGKKGINTFGDTLNLLKQFIEEIKKISPLAVINLGDLAFTENELKKEEIFKNINHNLFGNIDIPYFFLRGNQDTFFMTDKIYNEYIKNSFNFSFELGGYKHVLIDIEFDKKGLFNANDKTIKFIKDELNNSNLPIILYSHIPITEENEHLSYYHIHRPYHGFLSNSSEIRNIIKNTNCKLVVSGHTHFYYSTIIDGIKHITVPSFGEEKNGKPSGEYGILDLDKLEIEIKSV